MANISIYLNHSQQEKLDILTKKGLVEEQENIADNISPERNRSALLGLMIEREYQKLIEAEMIADAIEIDRENLGWNEQEETYQIIDLGQFGQ